jgi:hypothetical protein
VLLTCLVLAGAATVGSALVTLAVLYHVYFDRENLPDLGPFTALNFPPSVTSTTSTASAHRTRARVPADYAVRGHPTDRA